MTVARYMTDKETVAKVDKVDGLIFLIYEPDYSPCTCGPYKSLTEAENAMAAKGIKAHRTNSMCNRCVRRDCIGTANLVWSGCIYRKIEV